MSRAAQKEREKAEAAEELRKILKPGDKVYTVLRHVSASGMSRRIDVYIIEKNRPVYLSGYVGKVLGYTRHKDGGLVVGGCGMDMGFHIVHNLGYALWWKFAGEAGRDGNRTRKMLGDAPSCEHCIRANDDAPRASVTDATDKRWLAASGYALSHSWL